MTVKERKALRTKFRRRNTEQQEQHAEIIRVLWRHENDLMNARFTWFVTMQTIFFAGLGISLEKGLTILTIPICLLGLFSSFSTMAGFSLSFEAGKKLGGWWQKNLIKYNYDGPPITGNPVRIKQKRSICEWFQIVLSPWKSMPIAFVIAWVLVILCLYHQVANSPSVKDLKPILVNLNYFKSVKP